MNGWLWAYSEATGWFRCKYGKFGNCHSFSNDSHALCGNKVGPCVNLEKSSRYVLGWDFQVWRLQFLIFQAVFTQLCVGKCAKMALRVARRIELAFVSLYLEIYV